VESKARAGAFQTDRLSAIMPTPFIEGDYAYGVAATSAALHQGEDRRAGVGDDGGHPRALTPKRLAAEPPQDRTGSAGSNPS